MKVWALARDKKTKEYFSCRKTGKRLVTAAIEYQLGKLDNIEYLSTHKLEEDRVPMHLSRSSKSIFFKYPKGVNVKEDYYSESLTHMMIIESFLRLKEITFYIVGKPYLFKFDKLFAPNKMTALPNGGKYLPDLYGEFSNTDNPFFEKWNGQVAIEITHTSKTKEQKIKDLEKFGIPIIEHETKPSVILKNEHRSTAKQIEAHENHLDRIYSNKVYAKVISNPVSVSYHKQKISSLETKIRNNQKSCDMLVDKNDKLSQSVQLLNHKVSERVRVAELLQEQLEEREIQIRVLKNSAKKIQDMPLLARLYSALFKFKQ